MLDVNGQTERYRDGSFVGLRGMKFPEECRAPDVPGAQLHSCFVGLNTRMAASD